MVYPDSPREKIKFRPDPPAVAHLEGAVERSRDSLVSLNAADCVHVRTFAWALLSKYAMT